MALQKAILKKKKKK